MDGGLRLAARSWRASCLSCLSFESSSDRGHDLHHMYGASMDLAWAAFHIWTFTVIVVVAAYIDVVLVQGHRSRSGDASFLSSTPKYCA